MCDKTFTRKYNLRRHLENAHFDEETDTSESNDGYENDHHTVMKKCKTESSQSEDTDTVEDSSSSVSESSDDESETDDSEMEDEDGTELEDNVVYRDWLEEAKETTDDMWRMKYEKYINEGMSEQQAKEKADMKILWAVKKNFFNRFKDFLFSYRHLKDDETFQDIVVDLEENIDRGIDIQKAVNKVLAKNQSKFDGLFEQIEDENIETAEESDD